MRAVANLGLLALLLSIGVATSRIYHLAHPGAIPYKKAKALVAEENFREAIPYLKFAEAKGFKRNDTDELLVQTYLRLDLVEEALPYLKRVVTTTPDIGHVRALAGIYDRQGDVDRAVEVYDRYQDIVGKNEDALVHLAELCSRQKNYHRAQALYREVLERNPGNAEARVELAEMLSWQGEYDDALRELDRVKDQNWMRRAEIARARALNWGGRFAEAAQVYEGILSHAS